MTYPVNSGTRRRLSKFRKALGVPATAVAAESAKAGVSVRDPTPRPVRESRPEVARGLVTQLATLGLPGVQREFLLHPDRKFRYDVALPNARIVIDIDGGAWLHTKGKTNHGHGQGRGFERDRLKDALAVVLGFTVLRFTPDQVKAGIAAPIVRQVVARIDPLPAHIRKLFKLAENPRSLTLL
jgi:very-short-patch-repair endonuclease